MAIALQDVLAKLDEKTEWSKKAIETIDSELSNRRVVQNNVMNKDKNPTWRFGIEGTATPGDKEFVIQQYRDAGWGSVEVINSEENGEHPGMCGVILKRTAE